MLQALSNGATSSAVRPKLMTLVFDKKAGSSNDRSKGKETLVKEKQKADTSMATKPRTILSSNCYELNTQTSAIVGTVQLHLTSYHDILVMDRSGDNSHCQSVSRRHSVEADSITDHTILPKVLSVESTTGGSKQLYLYQMDKQKTVKLWVDKIQSIRKDTKLDQLSCIANGGAKHSEVSEKEAGDRNTLPLKKSPDLSRADLSSSVYSQGPGSPVAHRTNLALPGSSKKKKSRTLERLTGRKGSGRIGGLFRRSTDSQIIVNPEEFVTDIQLSTSSRSAENGIDISGEHDVNIRPSCSTGSVNSITEDTQSQKNGSLPSIAPADNSPVYSTGTSLDDIILEEEPGGVVIVDHEDDSDDGASETFSCNSSRCSSTRSYGRRGIAGSHSSIGNRVVSQEEQFLLQVTEQPIMRGCQSGDGMSSMNEMGVARGDNQAQRLQPGLFRKASEQVMGLLQMRSFRERGRPRRSGKYVRGCYSVSDLDHMIYNNDIIDNIHQPTNQIAAGELTANEKTDTLSTTNTPEPGNRSLLTTPTSAAMATSPTPSQHSESDNAEDFSLSRFHHMQIRRDKWKHSPRIQSPRIQSPRIQSPQIQSPQTQSPHTQSPRLRRTESYQQEKGEPERGGAISGRSVSVSPTSQHTVEQWSSRSNTPSEVFSNGSGYNTLHRSSDHTHRSSDRAYSSKGTLSSTLPRLKRNRQRITSDTVGKGSAFLPKSPKITRLFHKRQASSGSLGKILDLKSDQTCPDHTPLSGSDHAPFLTKLHQFPAKDVAIELTLMDAELLRRIEPDELKDAAWTKKATKELLAPNVLAMVRAFNQLALLVPTEILAETTPQARAKVITAYIRIASRCRSLHNYNSLKAVLAGLQCTPIYRLNKTWRAVPSRRRKQFENLCELMSEEENWRCYREKLHRHFLNNAHFIPFLGMFLTQVIQMDSFKDIKKSKVTESPLSKSYSENNSNGSLQTSMFDHTDIDPVTFKARRRRSASLGDHSFYPHGSPQREEEESVDDHTPVFSANNSMDDRNVTVEDGNTHEVPSILQDLENGQVTSLSDVLLNDSDFSIITGVADSKMTNSSHSSESETDNTLLAPPSTNSIAVPTVEVSSPMSSSPIREQSLTNARRLSRSCETDGGFDPSSSYNDTLVVRRRSKEALSLDDISLGFKRRSMSLETLVRAYKENRLSLFQMGHQNSVSFEESDDEEDLDDDEGEGDQGGEDKERDSLEGESFFLNGTTCSEFGETMSDFDTSISTMDSSMNSSQLLQLQDERKVETEDIRAALDAVEVKEDGACHFELPSEDLESKSANPTPCASRNIEPDGIKVKRSKSQSSKGTLRGNKIKLRKPKSFAAASASDDIEDVTSGSSEDVLLRFQTASLGCVLGNSSRVTVRTLLHDAVPNTEKENHRLSLERE